MRLIDADELLRLSHRFHISEFDRDGVEIIYADTVRNAPTVETQKTGKWIPVSERLPEPHKAVLAYAPKYNNIWAVTITDSGKWLMWTTGIPYEYNQDFNGELVAWMPLPEPYKENES